MPYAWRTAETDWFGNIKYVDRPVIELANDTVTSFPSREYMGFGKKNTDEEIDDIIEDIDSKIEDGTAVQSISDEELAEGLRKGMIRFPACLRGNPDMGARLSRCRVQIKGCTQTFQWNMLLRQRTALMSAKSVLFP